MTEEEWQRQMDEYTAKRDQLNSQISDINKEIDALKKTSADKDAAISKAEEDMYASVGSTKAGVADWRAKFEALEKDCKSKKFTKAELDIRYAELDKSKIKCLPEFWNRWNDLRKCIDGVTGTVTPPAGYTVVKGDCLWKIAGKKEIYGNPRVWPAIWEANKAGVISAPPGVKKTIPNPHWIYPGQVLKIPVLTDAQKKDAIDQANKYRYRSLRKRVVKKVATELTADEKKKAADKKIADDKKAADKKAADKKKADDLKNKK
ncbi:MAG TPA: LysM peptidoglycan-binding domain-containing protein [Ignavibacteria bacterium]